MLKSKKSRKSAKIGYLHIGADKAVRSDDIIGIFDIDNTTVSKHTRAFLNKAEKKGIVENLAPDIPVSFVVVSGDQEKVYFSQYSSRSLEKRLRENGFGI